MANFPFELVSPERQVYSGLVSEVIVPGTEGEFGVLAGHAPFVSTLKPGILTIKGDGEVRKLPSRYVLAGRELRGELHEVAMHDADLQLQPTRALLTLLQ